MRAQRPGSARGPAAEGDHKVIFGRSYSNSNNVASNNCAKKQQPSTKVLPQAQLNKETLEKFKQDNGPFSTNVEDALNVDENINSKNVKAPLPPKTPNYGKTPKYIEKYKEEFRAKEDARLEAKAAKHRPAGTKVLAEEERVATLENLKKNKDEVTKLLMQMPISMRTESLKK